MHAGVVAAVEVVAAVAVEMVKEKARTKAKEKEKVSIKAGTEVHRVLTVGRTRVKEKGMPEARTG